MEKDFLMQVDEKVNEARGRARSPWRTKELIEKAKEFCIQNIQKNWLDSIPESVESNGKLLITANVILGKRGTFSYAFDLPNGEELVISSWVEAAGIVREIVDELTRITNHEVQYEVHQRTNTHFWSLEVSFFWWFLGSH